ncbi:histone acetyltransferase type B catalytic subunit [Coprinellus micaceus]|uniref:Histone acetyltransferase type B catalytic subunit n=1 Tax=Coprinellus micaceus TaxID=71717 RepID=A0A4Y7TQK1_COPMI|nr:histone acetyltransferase type B catalytic subunit [Coprinellus micaceus]
MADWASDSNDAVTLSMVRAKEDKEALTEEESYEGFHPGFTYPIYGEDEKIYGYKDLVIDLRFASGSLTQYLNVTFSEKLAASTADDPKTTLSEFIPEDYLTDEAEFLKHVEEDATAFRPSGKLIHTYTRPSPSAKGKGKGSASAQPLDANSEDVIEYEVYHTTWDTHGFREYHRKMQLFILLYIEGGSYIQEDEETWEFVLLFEKRKRRSDPNVVTYHFIGYSSLYPFYHYPESLRMRLSQFVILPPYQRAGHGSELYNAIYQYVFSQANIAELTVEDPAEAFEDLRDKNDLLMLLSHEQFLKEAFGEPESYGGGRVGGVGKAGRAGRGGGQKAQVKGKIVPPSDKAWLEKWRKGLKIALRQFQRLTEMLILFKMDMSDARVMRAYRLQVKERLYRFNFEILAQIDKEERHEKLEETFQSVKDDYHRILALVS